MERKGRRAIYNKLVRDRIPEIIRRQGGTPATHTADSREYWRKLKEKLVEEVAEFVASEQLEELADIAEVLDAILRFKKIRRTRVRRLQQQKAQERGRFSRKIILERS